MSDGPIRPTDGTDALPGASRPRPGERPLRGDRPSQAQPSRRLNLGWPRLTWVHWGLLGLVTTGTVGVTAALLLLKMPASPNCLTARWPLVSASHKLYCANAMAEQSTLDGLREAIALADSLPREHPLRTQADQYIEVWSRRVLALAEELYRSGDLQGAIAATAVVPAKSTVRVQVDTMVARWQQEWQRAERIYQQAQDALRQQDWREATLQANQLLSIDNEYWRVTRFDALGTEINQEREAYGLVEAAEERANSGRLEDLLAAIEMAQKVPMQRYVRNVAQAKIALWVRDILDIAQSRLDRRDLEGALAAAGAVPAGSALKDEAADFVLLARAHELTWVDTPEALQQAIEQVRRLGSNRPLYYKAQELASRWQDEIQDLAMLSRARELARSGRLADLQGAIAQAGSLSADRPRWEQAQSLSRTWQRRIETIEDGPYLSQARQIARQRTIEAYYSAMSTAAQIPPGRALYDEAQRQIDAWRDEIETIQDQPTLDRAEQYAASGNLRAAVAEASRIGTDRALYNKTRRRIQAWQDDLDSLTYLQQAQEAASPGSADALSQAIGMAERLPSTSSYRAQAQAQIEAWSTQLLAIARSQVDYDSQLAIATAQKVPASSSVHAEAQDQIQRWQTGRP